MSRDGELEAEVKAGAENSKYEVADTYAAVSDEARRTLNHQVSWIRQIDQKAIQILRSNILLIGLSLTALSIFVRTDDVNLAPYINVLSVSGVAALLGSTFFAGVTYVSSRFKGGLHVDDIQETCENEYPPRKFFDELSRGYEEWIGYNDLVIKFNAWLCTITILLAIDAVILMSFGIAVGASGLDGSRLSYIMLIGLVVLLIFANFCVFKITWIIGILDDRT